MLERPWRETASPALAQLQQHCAESEQMDLSTGATTRTSYSTEVVKKHLELCHEYSGLWDRADLCSRLELAGMKLVRSTQIPCTV